MKTKEELLEQSWR